MVIHSVSRRLRVFESRIPDEAEVTCNLKTPLVDHLNSFNPNDAQRGKVTIHDMPAHRLHEYFGWVFS